MAQRKPQAPYLQEAPALDLGVFDAYLSGPGPQPQAAPTGGVLARMGDAGLSLLKGAIAVPEAAVGLADLATGGRAGQLAEEAGFRPAQAREYLDTMYSDAQQAANREVQEAEGFVPVLGAALRNPSTIVHAAIESLPLMGSGGVVARGLAKALPRMGMAAAAGAGEGVVTAGSQAEQIRQGTADGLLTPEQAGVAAASGATTGVLGAIAGRLANRLGIGDVDQLVAGGAAQAGAHKGFVRKVLEGALSEGVLEELPQSVQEQVAVNYALGQPLDEGVDQAAVMGMLSGGLMGGAAGPMVRAPAGDVIRETKLPVSGPVTRAVNAGVEAEAGRVDLGLPTLSQQQADAAMAAMEKQARTDEKGLRAAGRADKSGLPPLPDQAAAPAAGDVVPEGSAAVIDSPFLDRVLTLREQMADGAVRDAVRAKFGPQAFSTVAYYANAADNLALPERTRENMVEVAERMVGDALLQPLPGRPGMARPGAPLDRLAAPAAVARIGLDQRPTGRLRVGPDGVAVPETRADAISTAQREQQRAELGKQAPQPAPAAAPAPAPASGTVPALPYATAPTGRMLAGRDGVRAEVQADRINQAQAAGQRQQQAQQQRDIGLTPDVQRAQALRLQEDAQPGDVLNPQGEPFRNEGAARRAQRQAGGTVLPVRGGWVVRPVGSAPAPAAAAPAAAAPVATPADPVAVDRAANEAATSPTNDRPVPTDAQREAGNFKKGHLRVAGLDVTVEYPSGSQRSGRGADGREWRRVMRAHYGYLKRTEGADGENIDVFVGARPESQTVYVIDQQKADGSFDEHKVMLAYPSEDAARRGYLAHYPRGWKVGPMRAMSLGEFKAWVKDGDKQQPAAAAPAPAAAAKLQAAAAPEPAPAVADPKPEVAPAVEAAPPARDTSAASPPPTAQERTDDPARSTPPPARDQPLAEGDVPEGVRGARAGRGAGGARAGDRRADDRGVRSARGRGPRPDDETEDLGNRRGHGDLPGRADGDLGRRVRRVPADPARGDDFRPGPGGLTRQGSWFETAARNVELIELAQAIEQAGRPATADEQARLAKYVGFGAGEIRNALFPVPSGYAKLQEPDRLIWPNLVREARWKPLAERLERLPRDWQRSILQSTQYAHYTSEGLVRSIWAAVGRLGFTGGKVLEPGSGVGAFAMLMPEAMRGERSFTGVELDGPTALIARLLSPRQNMLHDDFIKRVLPTDFFDLAIGNPPFARTKVVSDPQYARLNLSLHDYFFAKGIDRVRPGGLMVFVTSHHTMDKQADRARRYLADRADLLGAIRLPQTAFDASAGTKVVTDVLFLRKRLAGETPASLAWNEVRSVETPDGVVTVNEYFAAHPHMVLGQQRISGNRDDQGRRISGLRSDGEYTVVSYDQTADELDAKFAAAVEHLPRHVYSVLTGSSRTARQETAKVDFDPQARREGVVYVGEDGTLMRVDGGVGRPLADMVKLSDKDTAWLKAFVGLRERVQEARAAQLEDGDWEAALKRLNDAYDAFRQQFGPIGDFRVQTRKSTDEDGHEVETSVRILKNRRLFREDYDAAIVTQLEDVDESGEIVKGSFLRGRTIGRPLQREVKTVGDALAVSLDELGHLDIDDVARRIHLPRDEAIEALGAGIYRTPQGPWQLADEYLAGDVVTKLDEAIEAARLDDSLERNVEALKAVQPDKLGPSQISVKLGASWVPEHVIDAFAKEIEAGAVRFDPKTESWQVEGGNLRSQRRAGAEYGTADRSPAELLEAALNSRPVTVKKKLEQKEVTDAEATTAAAEAMRKIKDRFKAWVWTDAQRTSELVEIYNRRFNNIAPRRFDGSHLSLPGVSLRFKLHPHQLRAIWRQIQTGDTYLAHAVGAGKTIEMIAGGMEQRRLGLIRKPMYVVPNHMLEQFANEFMELYPLANIMVADDENFSAERRRAFVAAATLNAPDAIILTHSAFERIGVKEESVAPIRDQVLHELEMELASAENGDRVRRSQLQQQIEAVTQRFDRIVGAGGKDGAIKFEDIGADFVYVDEAHAFRKLDFTTNQKIKGIDPGGSRRAMDMYVKTRWLQQQRPGRAMVFASGTPVTNTMGELYTIMRFFAADELDRGGISTFDAWSRQFGESVAALEANAAGRYEVVERFAKFDNVPELMSRVRQFMDVLTSEHLGALVKRPDVEGGKPKLVAVEATPALKAYMKAELVPRLEKARRWKPTRDEPFNPDPVIAITSDGRFAALDPRFFGAAVDESTPTKLTVMADAIAAEYRASAGNVYADKDGRDEAVTGGTQIVFYNLGFGAQSQRNRGFNARAALTRRLVEQGVKREHIAWFDDADTDAKKEAIFKAMRAGQLRVLIGSAKKMGTGVNVQKRLTMLHYFDPPWYPSDVEQPHGRIIRQGNQNPQVRIQWYATRGTYDATMWQMVGRKQRFIDQAFTGDKSLRSMEDMSEASQYEQAAAVASGDPRALQLAGLRQDVERLERLQAAHASEQVNVRHALAQAEMGVSAAAQREKSFAAAFKVIGERYVSFTTGKVGRATFDKPGEFGQALKDAFNQHAAERAVNPRPAPVDVATVGDLPLRMHPEFEREGKPTGNFDLMVHVGSYEVAVLTGSALGAEVDAVGLARRVVNRLNDIEASLRRAREDRVRHGTDVTRLRRKFGAPFEHQQELAQAVADLRRLEDELRSEGEVEAAAAAAAAAPPVAVAADGSMAGEAEVPLQNRTLSFDAAVDAALAEGADLRAHVPMGRTPALLKWLGLPDKPLVTTAQLLDKMHRMHGLTAAQIKTLPQMLADPVMVLRSDTRDGRYLVVPDLVSNGRALVLVVDPVGRAGAVHVVFVPSAYPKDDPRAFERWIRAGLVEYVHKSRSRQLATTAGLQLPGVVQRAVGFNVKKYRTDADRPPGEQLASRGRPGAARAGHIERAIRPIVNAWQNGPTSVTVVQSIEDLPADVQAGLKAVDAEGEARAFLVPESGRVFLIADNLADVQDAQFALFHEVYGHLGLRALLGDGYEAAMVRLRSANTRLAAEAAHWFALYGPQEVAARVEGGMPRGEAERTVRALAVEEALADRAAMGEPVSFLRWLLGRVQAALRRLGLNRVADWMENHSEAETLDLLRRARWAVQGAAAGHALRHDPRDGDTPVLSRGSPLEALRRINQQSLRESLADHLADLVDGAGARVSWWDKTIGTQYAKAEKYARSPATAGFKTVFDAVQSYLEGVSTLANESADQAPAILPSLENWRDLAKRGLSDADAQAIAAPIFEGTLVDKKVFDDDELRERFSLTAPQIGQYRAFLAAVNTSLDQAVAADVLRLLGDAAPPAFKRLAMSDRRGLRRAVDQFLSQQAAQAAPADRDTWEGLLAQVREKYARIDQLQTEGYAPLMRFGKFAVTVRDPQSQEVLYFGLFENRAAANRMARELGQDESFRARGAAVEQGVLSQEQFKLFAGVPVESLEMFAAAIGADKAEIYQEFLRLTKNNRSALKRLIQRKGTAGFSQDVPRVLAAFVTSNARLASAALNLPGASQAAERIRAGDVKDEAVGLIETATNPTETASALRGLLFMNFIGGSVASAFVNLTQPMTMTAPYLSQWGGMGRASARLLAAGKMAASGKVADVELRNALAKAERDGIVSPQEIHHLTAQAMATWGTNPVLKKAAFIWGSAFSLAEQFNRRVTFLAAYQTAKAEGIDDPFGFAERAVIETQGLYNRGNAPNWARNPVGAVALTFKQFSIHYVEWLTRMWRQGPAGRRAVAWALVVLLVAAGADGLPFAEDLDDLIDTLAQALGLDFSSARAKREFVADTLGLGDEVADAFTRGLSSLPGVPIDLSLRLSMGNLVPASGLFLRSNTDRSRDVLELAGAGGSAARQGIDAGEKLLQGDVLGSLRAAVPVALQNAIKGVEVWSTGEYRDTRGRKVMDADALDGFMKLLGFQPAEIARESRGIALEQRRVQLARNVEAEIADAWARGLVDEDPDAVQEAQQRLAKWNADNPRSRIVIRRTQIARRARELRAGRSERFVRTAPRELRAGVAEALE